MDLQNKKEMYADFYANWKSLQARNKDFSAFVKGKKISSLFADLNKVNGIGLRNLSFTHKEFSEDDKKRLNLVATKDGIKRGYEGSHAHDLDARGFADIVINKETIRAWITKNKPKKLDAFNDLVEALEIKVDGFGFDGAKGLSGGLTGFVDNFSVKLDVPTLCLENGEILSCVANKIWLKKQHYSSEDYTIYIDLLLDNGSTKTIYFSNSMYKNDFEWLIMNEIMPNVFDYFNKAQIEIETKMVSYDKWERAVRDKLTSYMALISL